MTTEKQREQNRAGINKTENPLHAFNACSMNNNLSSLSYKTHRLKHTNYIDILLKTLLHKEPQSDRSIG